MVSFSQVKVDLIDHMGDDDAVVDAARVSFDKLAKNYTPEQNTKLINYLATHGHWTPFSHCIAKFRIKAPVFVARQLFRHTVGLTINEVSRRYVDTPPEFYKPSEWRGKPVNKKQGSSDEVITELSNWYADSDYDVTISEVYEDYIRHGTKLYNAMIKEGVAPEQARMILPQSMMTEWIWTGSLYAFARIGNLRLKPDAQEETRVIAHGINEHMIKLFPVSWKALVDKWYLFSPEKKKEVKGA